jgi:hypothetical protein
MCWYTLARPRWSIEIISSGGVAVALAQLKIDAKQVDHFPAKQPTHEGFCVFLEQGIDLPTDVNRGAFTAGLSATSPLACHEARPLCGR